ncbi:hypothetical protein AMIS_76770 [Actinoplanes missouriensis 431]|uniref:Uncharacterized protein n=1 Tax=Actinoplanes missouriensis (strain ATCC 14538 / DSM 43046 / CBS 188.64 / JCM 3121 / NBRC 102363 / NCIMB 12654 / NRRL B-3342 / UNCC 431) TaxID=512565 RepID=I0HIR0_ACTM4|nr:hypothetical protein [Actinoplanes missouriensis]BAL92897.1 hypothetical protein AMIS_76770 [Actinoplanes missouriensis 431]
MTANGRRRLRTAAVVTAWIAVLLALSLWSVRRDPPTVAEQRDLGQALPELRRATGALIAAADDERWVLRLGELRIEDCSITPVRSGRAASRDLTVIVPEGDARTALEGIAAGLPPGYRASVTAVRGGTRLSLYADAGEFIAIDAAALSADQILTVRVDSGCRPSGGTADVADPAAGPVPAALTETLTALRADAAVTPRTRAVACPDGGTAATFVADAGSRDAEDGPLGVPDGTVPVWSDAGGWAYRMGPASVVVTAQGGRSQVSVTTTCGQ